MEPPAAVTTPQMWGATATAAVLLAVLAAVAWRRVRLPVPPRLASTLLALGVVWFTVLYGWAAWTFWDTCYQHVLPPAARWLAPFVGAAWGAMGWLFWWLATRIRPTRPALPFLLLGALQSLPGHLVGIYVRGLLEGCEPVRGITPASALVFGLFEFGVYWAVVLLVAHAVARRRGNGGGRADPAVP